MMFRHLSIGPAMKNQTAKNERLWAKMPPKGFTLVELIGTSLLLGILFSMTIPMLVIVAHERRSTQQRQFALQHLANLLEQSVTRDWNELIPGDLPIPIADPDLLVVLPGLEEHLTVKQIDLEPVSRQVIASIKWQNHSGQMNSNLELSAWVYPMKEAP